MNWYINNAGAAEGPKDDAAMAELVREKKLSLDSLVWHAGLDAWQTVAQISPAWLGVKAAPVVEKKAADKKDSGVRRLAEPKAPTAETEEKKEGGGFLKRLFGFGKKKG